MGLQFGYPPVSKDISTCFCGVCWDRYNGRKHVAYEDFLRFPDSVGRFLTKGPLHVKSKVSKKLRQLLPYSSTK